MDFRRRLSGVVCKPPGVYPEIVEGLRWEETFRVVNDKEKRRERFLQVGIVELN
jgi:hypothetical protein